jgi:hypothetical protein
MLLACVYALLRALLRLLLVRWRWLTATDIELLVLQHERRLLLRRTGGAVWEPGDRLWLAALSRALPPSQWHVLPVHPATLRRWHRELIQRRWLAVGRRREPGRPPLAAELQALIVRLAHENPRWGYVRIKGELLKLGHGVSATAIRMTLRRRGIPPAPQRAGLTWPVFLRAQAAAILASAPVLGRAPGTCLSTAWLLRAVLGGHMAARDWDIARRIAVARRVPRAPPQLRGPRSAATVGAPQGTARVSGVWVSAAGGQRVPAEAERRTDAPSREGGAWRRPSPSGSLPGGSWLPPVRRWCTEPRIRPWRAPWSAGYGAAIPATGSGASARTGGPRRADRADGVRARRPS